MLAYKSWLSNTTVCYTQLRDGNMNNIPSAFTHSVFSEVDEIDPLELVGNARLALHHHMAPAGSLDEPDQEAQTLSEELNRVDGKG